MNRPLEIVLVISMLAFMSVDVAPAIYLLLGG